MNYEKALQYLYQQTPAFHQVGGKAYKPGLERSLALNETLKNPHRSYRIIHVAGTNGKGSVSHLLAAILRESKYKIGLYTSPHLTDFCERIRVNGKKISRQYVVDFVGRNRPFIETLKPSFFELTSAMAFDYFRHKKVDFAVIETGLGGRLDSTNIITPFISIITNISTEHTQYLGDTVDKIATEKAGIIKPYIPIIIGNASDPQVRNIFTDKAESVMAPIHFAEEEQVLHSAQMQPDGQWLFQSTDFGEITGELRGPFQKENAQTVLTALRILVQKRVKLPYNAICKGFRNVVETTGLKGRWQTIHLNPTIICDTGHNTGAWKNLGKLLDKVARHHTHLHMIIGMAGDKDTEGVLRLIPKNATYYFTQASTQRALPVCELFDKAGLIGLHGAPYPTVYEAVRAALGQAQKEDLIFIGGSTFVVADALPMFPNTENTK